MKYNYSYKIEPNKNIKKEITEDNCSKTSQTFQNIKHETLKYIEVDVDFERYIFETNCEKYTLNSFCKQLNNIKAKKYTEKYNNELDKCLNLINNYHTNNHDIFVFMVVFQD